LVGAYAVGNISGGSFNPAVTVGGSIMNIFTWGNIWIHLVAELVAGATAAYVFRYTHPENDHQPLHLFTFHRRLG
jgi:aquaporin Z